MIGIEETYIGLFLRVICEGTEFKLGYIYNCCIYDDDAIIFRAKRDEHSTKRSYVLIDKKLFDNIAIDNFTHEVSLYVAGNYEITIINNSNSVGTCVRYYIN
jgi:hypothetical protein